MSDSLPVLYSWPVCDLAHRYDVIVAWRQRYIQDVGTLAQEIEVPQRWYDWVVAALAAKMAGELPEVPDDREVKLINQERTAWVEAQSEESDGAPLQLLPGISVYTR